MAEAVGSNRVYRNTRCPVSNPDAPIILVPADSGNALLLGR